MENICGLYYRVLSANEDAFAQQLYAVAYHSLSAAMGCALHLRDAAKMEEIEQRAKGQFARLSAHFTYLPTSNAPLEMTLYSSLGEIAYTQRILLQKSAQRV